MRRFQEFNNAELAILGIAMVCVGREDSEFMPFATEMLKEINEELDIKKHESTGN